MEEVLQLAAQAGGPSTAAEVERIRAAVDEVAQKGGDLGRLEEALLAPSSQGLAAEELAELREEMEGEDPAQVAQVALALGASADQAARLAAEQGATPQELAQIRKTAGVAKGIPKRPVRPEVAQDVRDAISGGATVEEAIGGAQEGGATLEEVEQLALALKPHGVLDQDAPVLAQQNKKTPSGGRAKESAPASDVAVAALLEGASEEQALRLARDGGASKEQLTQLRATMRRQARAVKEAIDKGATKEQAFRIGRARTKSGFTPETDRVDDLQAAINALKAIPEKEEEEAGEAPAREEHEEVTLGPLGGVEGDDDARGSDEDKDNALVCRGRADGEWSAANGAEDEEEELLLLLLLLLG